MALGSSERGRGHGDGRRGEHRVRLQVGRPLDGILVGDTTYRATSECIEYREAEPVQAKGKAERRPGLGGIAPGRGSASTSPGGGAELVGRDDELACSVTPGSRAERERSPQLVTLVGEPGIGKSRLLFELWSTLDRETRPFVYWRQGRSLPYGEGVSFWALGEMVKARPASSSRTRRRGRREAPPRWPARDPRRRRLWISVTSARWSASAAPRRRRPPPRGLRRPGAASSSAGGAVPLVLVFEDLHWADDGLLDFIDHLVGLGRRAFRSSSCARRPELLERRPGWGGGKPNAVTVSLSPLSDKEPQLLVDLLAEKTASRRRAARLLARAGGNPLYAEEYVRMLAEPFAGPELPLPETLQGIIAPASTGWRRRRRSCRTRPSSGRSSGSGLWRR